MLDAGHPALPNPGASTGLPCKVKLVRGENVLILGATGVTGKLAVKIAKLLGAARVVAAGRNQQVLNALEDLDAHATISLALPATELSEAFLPEAGQSGFQVVIDYVWGGPAEAFLAAITRREILDTAGIPARDVLVEAFQQVMAYVAKGDLHT